MMQVSHLGRGVLAGSVVSRGDLSESDRDRMYALLSTYFEGTRRSWFENDLAGKESVIVLREMKAGQIQGFSTLTRMEVKFDSRDIVAIFSGDTIVAKEYWGETTLSRLWGQTVFAEADLITASRPAVQVMVFNLFRIQDLSFSARVLSRVLPLSLEEHTR
jgi:hypothetical protein